MNTDQLRTNAAAMLAHADGKPVQYKSFASGADWRDLGSTGWEFTFEGGCFRPKPEPVVRPWSKPEDVPLNCWLQTPKGNASFIIHVATGGVAVVAVNSYATISWEELGDYTHSTDRKTWLPCTVTVQP